MFSVCVCVLEILVLKIFRLRDYFERFLCWLDHWLSCMLNCIHICVFLPLKNCFEKLARHLLDTSSIHWYLSSFSNLFLNAISTPPRYLVDRSRKLLPPRQLLDTWWIDWASILETDSLLLDTSAVNDHFLNTSLDSFLETSRYLSCRALLKVLFKPPLRSFSHFFDLSAPIHLLNTLSFTPNLFLKFSSSFFKFFYTW